MFYTNDWLEEPGLKLSSLAARGLWIDMLCIMSAAHPRGYLKMNGKPITIPQLAIIVRSNVDEVTRLLTELGEHCVLSRNSEQVIYSRRIVRDEKIRQQNSRNGKRGGNPRLRHNDNPPVNGSLKPPLKRSLEDEDVIEDVNANSSERGLGKTEAGKPAAPSAVAEPPTEKRKRERKPPTGPHAEVIRIWMAAWKEKYGTDYPFNGVDGAKAADLLRACGGSVEKSAQLIRLYLADADKFFAGHPLTKLTSSNALSKFVANANPKVDENGEIDPFDDPAIPWRRS
jgi:hypothetical protein